MELEEVKVFLRAARRARHPAIAPPRKVVYSETGAGP